MNAAQSAVAQQIITRLVDACGHLNFGSSSIITRFFELQQQHIEAEVGMNMANELLVIIVQFNGVVHAILNVPLNQNQLIAIQNHRLELGRLVSAIEIWSMSMHNCVVRLFPNAKAATSQVYSGIACLQTALAEIQAGLVTFDEYQQVLP